MKQNFKLAYPVTHAGKEIAELDLRRPKNMDIETLEARKGGNVSKSLQLIADLAGVDVAVIRELDTEDSGQINDWLEPLLDPKGRRSASAGS